MRLKDNHLLKISSVIVMSLGIAFGAIAEMLQPTALGIGTNATVNFGNQTLDAAYAVRLRFICAKGTYVDKCGNDEIGFNWLRPLYIDGVATRNYYEAANTQSKRYEKMREVFSNTNPQIGVTFKESNQISTASYEQVRDDRNKILNYFCSDLDAIRCKSCPNNAKVEASTVSVTTVSTDVTNNTIVSGWNIRTFADCYLDEFEDTTGTYVYQNGTDNAEKCYFGETGSSRIYQGANVTERTNVINEISNDIP